MDFFKYTSSRYATYFFSTNGRTHVIVNVVATSLAINRFVFFVVLSFYNQILVYYVVYFFVVI